MGAAAATVRLRTWRPGDLDVVTAMVGDEQVQRWSSLPDDPARWLAENARQPRGPARAICLTSDPRALGHVALRMPGHGSAAPAIASAAVPAAELSYWLVPSARGHGLAGPAVAALLAEAVPGTGLRSVVFDVELTNVASWRVAERLGARRRGPTHTEVDRRGVARELAVLVLDVGSDRPLKGVSAAEGG